jgi:hypothetical protein
MSNAKRFASATRAANTRKVLRPPSTRDAVRAQVEHFYIEKRESIRAVAERFCLSYGTVHTLLGEAGVTLRERGGNTRGRSA